MLMTMEDESNNKTQLKLPRIFTLAGFALIALAIFSFFMSVLCGLGGSGSCDGDSSTYLLYGIFGVLAIAIAQVLNKDRSISLANMWLLLWILVLLAIFIIDQVAHCTLDDTGVIHVRQEDAPEYHGYIVADSSTSFEN